MPYKPLSQIDASEIPAIAFSEGQLNKVGDLDFSVPFNQGIEQSRNSRLVHTCKSYLWYDSWRRDVIETHQKTWDCKACIHSFLIPRYYFGLKEHKWDYFLTLTTNAPFLPPVSRIKSTKKALKRFLAAIKRRYHVTKFFWGVGATENGYIHFHLLLNSAPIDEQWVLEKWHSLTGCFEINLRPAKKSDLGYILYDNVALFPSPYKVDAFSLPQCIELRFYRRVGYSRGLIKPPKKSNRKLSLIRFPKRRTAWFQRIKLGQGNFYRKSFLNHHQTPINSKKANDTVMRLLFSRHTEPDRAKSNVGVKNHERRTLFRRPTESRRGIRIRDATGTNRKSTSSGGIAHHRNGCIKNYRTGGVS